MSAADDRAVYGLRHSTTRDHADPSPQRHRRGASRRSITGTLISGAAAGATATIAMSAPMLLGRRLGLMGHQPPEEITGRLARGAGTHVRGASLDVAAAAAHLAFGGVAGALYASLRRVGPVAAGTWAGPAFGVVIWAIAYRLVLPRAGLIDGTERVGRTRDVVMLVAHLVYGAVLARLEGPADGPQVR